MNIPERPRRIRCRRGRRSERRRSVYVRESSRRSGKTSGSHLEPILQNCFATTGGSVLNKWTAKFELDTVCELVPTLQISTTKLRKFTS